MFLRPVPIYITWILFKVILYGWYHGIHHHHPKVPPFEKMWTWNIFSKTASSRAASPTAGPKLEEEIPSSQLT